MASIIAAIAVVWFNTKRHSIFAIEPPKDDAWLTKYKYAHRGLYDDTAPENSLAAMHKAIAGGYAIEVDLRLTADGHIVAFHDSDLKRMTGMEKKFVTLPFPNCGSLPWLVRKSAYPPWKK